MTRSTRVRLAGWLAVVAALVATELVNLAGPTRPSLLRSVQAWFIDTFGGALKDIAVALFGTGHKTALTIGSVAVMLMLAPLTARSEVRRRGTGPAIMSVFALGAVLASLGRPQHSVPVTVAAAVAGVLVGTAVLWLLLDRFGIVVAPGASRLGLRHEPAPADDDAGGALTEVTGSRREVLLWGLGTGAVVASAGAVAKGVGDAVRAERAAIPDALPPAASTASIPSAQPVDTPGLSPYITPNRDFYRIDVSPSAPYVVTDEWTVRVTGLVDRELELSYRDLLTRDLVEEVVTLSCVSNEVGDELVGNAVWTGIPLRTLLAEAGVHDGASQIVGVGLDGFTAGFPTGVLDDPDRPALVAVGMNGEPLPRAHGFPARLVVSGLYGYVSATKWLSEVRLTTWDDEDGYWIQRGWAKDAPVKTQSRIDVPRNRATVEAGPVAVAGVAWAPNRGIARVEVRIDDGRWRDASLGRVSSDDTWVQWRLDWDAEPGDHVITVRATDGTGATQGEEPVAPIPDGAEGWHTREVRVASS